MISGFWVVIVTYKLLIYQKAYIYDIVMKTVEAICEVPPDELHWQTRLLWLFSKCFVFK